MDGFAVYLENPPPAEDVPSTDANAASIEPEIENAKEEEPPMPADWFCPTCTLQNQSSKMSCEACGSERPIEPMLPQEEEEKPKSPQHVIIEEEDEENLMLKRLIEI